MTSLNLIETRLSLPIILPVVGSLVLLLSVSASNRFKTLIALLSVFAALLAQVVLLPEFVPGLSLFSLAISADPLAGYVNILLLIISVLLIITSDKYIEKEGISSVGEYYALLLMSLSGALVFSASTELITMFLGLETMSIALYALCASAVKNPRSSESALKYFILGSVASAAMLFGMVILYGLTGTTRVEEIAVRLLPIMSTMPLFLFAAGIFILGLLFKVALAPLHWWAPDVYQGAPTPVTAYMASVVKVSAFVVLIRVLYVLLADFTDVFIPLIWVCSALSMVMGNLIALRQRSIKRMLAYSSTAHAGYMAMALLSNSDQAIVGILFYLTIYSLMTVGAFGIVQLVCPAGKPDDISNFNGLAKRSPIIALLFTAFMLGFAGIPPMMGGLLGKFYLFNAVISSGYVGLAVIAVLSAAVAVYYYLRLLVAMYFVPADTSEKLEMDYVDFLVPLCASALMVILLGVIPDSVYHAIHGIVLSL